MYVQARDGSEDPSDGRTIPTAEPPYPRLRLLMDIISSLKTAGVQRSTIVAGVTIVSAVALSMLGHWEMTPESWGYWFFARIFSETGTFIVPDRSPLYTLYLNLFTWMGYPTAVTVQYLVSGTFVIASLVAMFRQYVGLRIALFGAFLWIPYLLQFAEPPVQMLSLASMSLAVLVRQSSTSRSGMAISYALLMMAVLLRATCIAGVLIFAAWDIFNFLKQKGLKELAQVLCPRQVDWPVGVVLVLLVWFSTVQSPHPWNNVWVATATWAPTNGKSLADAAFIQNFNIAYILRQYGSLEGKDHYFTNREIFGSASTMVEAIRANPIYVARQVGENFSHLPSALAQITVISTFRSMITGGEKSILLSVFLGLVYLTLSLAIVYGAFRAARDESMVIFLVASAVHTGITALSYVKVRWMYPMIPLLLLSAYWYGQTIKQWLERNIVTFMQHRRKTERSIQFQRWIMSTGLWLTPLFLVLLSNGASSWVGIYSSVISDLRDGGIHVLEQRGPTSLKASIDQWRPLIRDCKGVLTLESTFVGAFSGIPVERIYDIWEIPPFGHFNASEYDGLKPDRIDCVLISQVLSTAVGGGTNMKIRYENYVRPYVELLQKLGATTYDIDYFGQVVVLRQSVNSRESN